MKSILSIFNLILFSVSAILATPPADGLKIGDKATDFSLKNIDGNFVSLSDFAEAKGYVVIFTCNTCPYAKMYEDRITALHDKYAGEGFPVIAINPNDPEVKPGDGYDEMKVRAKEKSFQFPYLFDAGQAVYPQYGATKTPHVFVLDADMIVKYIGAIDDNPQDASSVGVKYVEDAIEAIANGKNPDPATTKAIGCGIKVKA
ncbi:MAG: thioredoxin family protein [Bacteroidota bacterium]